MPIVKACIALFIIEATALHVDRINPIDEAIDDLWDGLDLSSQEEERIIARQKKTPDSNKLIYVLMGPIDSGTHLLSALIKQNFGYLDTHQQRLFWKHALSFNTSNIYNVLRKRLPQPIEDSIAIVIVRSPVATVTAWKKMPYNMEPCVDRPYEEMDQPCKPFTIGPMEPVLLADPKKPNKDVPKKRLPGHLPGYHKLGPQFNSTMHLYNQYLQQYLTLLHENKFKKMLILKYENVVMNTERTLEMLATLFDLPVPSQPDFIERNQANGVGHTKAKRKIEDRTHLKMLNHSALEHLCKDKNKSRTLWRRFFVTQWSDTYNFDCRH